MRLIVLLLLLGATRVAAEPLRITTWNLNSSVAPPADSTGAENRLEGIATVLDSMNADIILLQQIRDRQTCERLAAMLKTARYRVAVCSAFTNLSGDSLPQVAILSKKPVVAARAEPWKAEGAVTPPGGFAFALIRHGQGEVCLVSAQFKDNDDNATKDDLERDSQLNILNREISATQLIQQASFLETKQTDRPSAIIVAGSFNTNPDEPQFVGEITLRLMGNAGFKNLFQGTPWEDRITRRGNGRYPDGTADYVFARNADFLVGPQIVATGLSEHLPLGCEAIIRPALLAARVPAPTQPAAQWQSIGAALFVVLLIACWWCLMGRKRFYTPPLAAVAAEAGHANLLSYPDAADALPAALDTLDEFESDGQWLPIQTRGHSRMQSLEKRAASAEQRARVATDLVRKGLVPHLARLMKDRLFHGVASQRAQLLLTQQASANQVAELEKRLAKITSQMQNRFGAYERRIAELEQALIAKEQLNRDLLDSKEKLKKPAPRPREEQTQSI